MGKTEAVPDGMYPAPEYLVNAIKAISDVAQSVRASVGELTELGRGEVYAPTWGLASWCQDDEDGERPQFVYTPLDINVSWHQRVGRGCFANRHVTRAESAEMLFDILSQMKEGNEVTYAVW